MTQNETAQSVSVVDKKKDPAYFSIKFPKIGFLLILPLLMLAGLFAFMQSPENISTFAQTDNTAKAKYVATIDGAQVEAIDNLTRDEAKTACQSKVAGTQNTPVRCTWGAEEIFNDVNQSPQFYCMALGACKGTPILDVKTVGQVCSNTGDCATGLTCVNRSCRLSAATRTSTGASPATTPATCTTSNDCGADETCDTDGTCKSAVLCGDPPKFCAPNQQCVNDVCQPAASPVPACTGLTVLVPLDLDKTNVVPGEKVKGTITYKNPCTTDFSVKKIVIDAKDPDPIDTIVAFTLTPEIGATTVAPGKEIAVVAELTIQVDDKTGVYKAFSMYRDAVGVGNWSKQSNTVEFTVTAPTTIGETCGGTKPCSPPLKCDDVTLVCVNPPPGLCSPRQCADGMDNDIDGTADAVGAQGLPADTDCTDLLDDTESAGAAAPPPVDPANPPPANPPAAACAQALAACTPEAGCCDSQLTCTNGTCQKPQNAPLVEICGDGIDNNGNAQVNENCAWPELSHIPLRAPGDRGATNWEAPQYIDGPQGRHTRIWYENNNPGFVEDEIIDGPQGRHTRRWYRANNPYHFDDEIVTGPLGRHTRKWYSSHNTQSGHTGPYAPAGGGPVLPGPGVCVVDEGETICGVTP